MPVKSQQELGGKEVWAAVGTPVVARLHTLASEIGDTICVYESDSYTEEQLLMAVAIGEIPRAASGQFAPGAWQLIIRNSTHRLIYRFHS